MAFPATGLLYDEEVVSGRTLLCINAPNVWSDITGPSMGVILSSLSVSQAVDSQLVTIIGTISTEDGGDFYARLLKNGAPVSSISGAKASGSVVEWILTEDPGDIAFAVDIYSDAVGNHLEARHIFDAFTVIDNVADTYTLSFISDGVVWDDTLFGGSGGFDAHVTIILSSPTGATGARYVVDHVADGVTKTLDYGYIDSLSNQLSSAYLTDPNPYYATVRVYSQYGSVPVLTATTAPTTVVFSNASVSQASDVVTPQVTVTTSDSSDFYCLFLADGEDMVHSYGPFSSGDVISASGQFDPGGVFFSVVIFSDDQLNDELDRYDYDEYTVV